MRMLRGPSARPVWNAVRMLRGLCMLHMLRGMLLMFRGLCVLCMLRGLRLCAARPVYAACPAQYVARYAANVARSVYSVL
jgi:hypothetical protein